MQYRSLGRCGTKVSVFGLGGWVTFGDSVRDEGTVRQIICAAYEAGINFFDSADIYARGACETVMGKVLKELPRDHLVISSKVFWPMSKDVNDHGLSRKHIHQSIDKTLQRLQTDYIDLYFCHRYDDETPLAETARAMDDLVHQGKVLYWGTSEWTGAQIREAQLLCKGAGLYPPQVEQPQYSLLVRQKFEQDVRSVAVDSGMGLVTWSPLASGLLSGKYDRGFPPGSRLARPELTWLQSAVATPEAVDQVRKFKIHADKAGVSRAQMAMAWLLLQPGISSVILGATRVEQLQENLKSLDVDLTKGLVDAVEKLFPA
jgi:voltage-dependent potassium channel beta subunit